MGDWAKKGREENIPYKKRERVILI